MNNKNDEIILIVGAQEVEVEFKDREGGEVHSGLLKKFFGREKPVDVDKIKRNLDQCLAGVSNVLGDLKQKAVDGWELDSVSVSLAISAEGSIGLATAGMEASIEVSFKPRQ